MLKVRLHQSPEVKRWYYRHFCNSSNEWYNL